MESWLWGYGLLRHSHDDIVAMACEHVDALDVLLAGKQFTLGNELTLVDCSVFSAVHGLLHMPVDHAGLQEYAKSKPNLVAYEKRVAALVL
jgi:glutathione S-transferase